MTRLFLYGTLKRGGSNHHLVAGQRFVGEAQTTPGYRLFRVADYPGLVPDPTGYAVAGEIWEVDEPTLHELDRLEGLDEGLYRRAPVSLQAPFDRLAVETYLYSRPLGRSPDIGPTWPVTRTD